MNTAVNCVKFQQNLKNYHSWRLRQHSTKFKDTIDFSRPIEGTPLPTVPKPEMLINNIPQKFPNKLPEILPVYQLYTIGRNTPPNALVNFPKITNHLRGE